ncbi:glyoxalase [Deinococcus sp. KSM4-11]|uniref:VOC family protein n=1 Tax=Deinococcus sp. KSM4-11 TaxID=2568654 RepID=UPI0010A2BEAB|nr:VOC family protein [Deinococcus sp. KSM4-11]THF85236.1 glyoxalase [Deinococcus sp. KSM4-11]
MTMKLNYIGFTVSDMERALAFYRLLGLPIPQDIPVEGHVEIEVDGLRIAWDSEALLRDLSPEWTPPSGTGRIGAGVQAPSPAGVDDVAARLRAAGYAVPEPFDAPWGQRYLTVTDPDGTPVDVFAWLPGSDTGH